MDTITKWNQNTLFYINTPCSSYFILLFFSYFTIFLTLLPKFYSFLLLFLNFLFSKNGSKLFWCWLYFELFDKQTSFKIAQNALDLFLQICICTFEGYRFLGACVFGEFFLNFLNVIFLTLNLITQQSDALIFYFTF